MITHTTVRALAQDRLAALTRRARRPGPAGEPGGVAGVWPAGNYGRRSGRAAGPVPGLCGLTGRRWQAAADRTASSPDRRRRGGCVAGQRGHHRSDGPGMCARDVPLPDCGCCRATFCQARERPGKQDENRRDEADVLARHHRCCRGQSGVRGTDGAIGWKPRGRPGHAQRGQPGPQTAAADGDGRGARGKRATGGTGSAAAGREPRSWPACSGDPELFFAESPDDTETAKALRRGVPGAGRLPRRGTGAAGALGSLGRRALPARRDRAPQATTGTPTQDRRGCLGRTRGS